MTELPSGGRRNVNLVSVSARSRHRYLQVFSLNPRWLWSQPFCVRPSLTKFHLSLRKKECIRSRKLSVSFLDKTEDMMGKICVRSWAVRRKNKEAYLILHYPHCSSTSAKMLDLCFHPPRCEPLLLLEKNDPEPCKNKTIVILYLYFKAQAHLEKTADSSHFHYWAKTAQWLLLGLSRAASHPMVPCRTEMWAVLHALSQVSSCVHARPRHFISFTTCSSGSLWIASWTLDWTTCSTISCAPVCSSPLGASCWVEQNPHLPLRKHRMSNHAGTAA